MHWMHLVAPTTSTFWCKICVHSVCQGLMVDQSDISRPYHCPNPLACPGGLMSANESTPMCTKGAVKKHKGNRYYSTRQTLSASGFNILTFLTPYPAAVFQNDIWSLWTAWMKPEVLPMAKSVAQWISCMQATEVLAVTPVPRILHAPTATSSFARNVWLGCLYVFHSTNQRDLQICVPACLNMWNQEGWWKGLFQRRVVSN